MQGIDRESIEKMIVQRSRSWCAIATTDRNMPVDAVAEIDHGLEARPTSRGQ